MAVLQKKNLKKVLSFRKVKNNDQERQELFDQIRNPKRKTRELGNRSVILDEIELSLEEKVDILWKLHKLQK